MFSPTILIIGFMVLYTAITICYLFSETSGNFTLRAVNKIGLAALYLLIFIFAFFKFDYMGTQGTYQIVALIGFALAFLGDVVLLWSFVVGGALFAAGNVALFVYELLVLSKNGIPFSDYWWFLLIFLAPVFYLFTQHFTKRVDFGKLGVGMPIYIATVSLQGCGGFAMMANAHALQAAGAGTYLHFTVFGAGLFFFMVSDYFLTAHEYVNKNNWVLRCNSFTYFIGIMLAAISFSL